MELLGKVNQPADLRKLSYAALETLCGEIRQQLIRTVAKNGGHLASNLGVVELTLALHRVFDFPRDQIVFDVGHQSYVHKMITGRYDRFSTIRTYGGLSGFPRREESPFDCFETGHASTSISAALGLARARDFRGEDYHVIALTGDGSLTGGMCYEALNDAGNSSTRLIVILNDNEMSIARNVGALSRHLTNLRVSGGWQSAKRRVKHFRRFPVVGKPVYRLMHGVKTLLKTALVKEKDLGFFETLGFEYFGPIDGHDLRGLEKTLRMAKKFDGPCVIHVKTRKGYGYDKAEEHPETFHGTPPFEVESGDRKEAPGVHSSGHRMASALAEMAEQDPRIIAITAAMPLGTGLDHFAERWPDRLLDTGIAEEHAATMAAGLAAGGMRPYFAVYASFFQRCHDQMIHDVCLQGLPVVFLLDRSGIGGEDGKTHHGLMDLASLLPAPGMQVFAPCDARELERIVRWTITQSGPCAVRYARDGSDLPAHQDQPFTPGKWEVLTSGKADLTLLAAGTMVRQALACAAILSRRQVQARVVNCSSIRPLDLPFLRTLSGTRFYTMEEHMATGGFGMFVTEACLQEGLTPPAHLFAVRDQFPAHGAHRLLLRDAGLDPDTMAAEILRRERAARGEAASR